MNDLKMALEPVLGVIADVISAFASFVSEHPALAAAITTIVTAIGILIGAGMALGPVFITLASYATYAGLSIGRLPRHFWLYSNYYRGNRRNCWISCWDKTPLGKQ